MASDPVNHIKEAADDFLRNAPSFKATRFERFVEHVRLSKKDVLEAFARDVWETMQDDWLLARAKAVMDEIHPTATTRHDFTVNRIRKRIGVSYGKFYQVVGPEWEERAKELPTSEDIVLAKLDEMVAANVALEELTVQKLYKAAGVSPGYGPWLGDKLRAARRELTRRQCEGAEAPPPGVDARVFPLGWIDLNGTEWDLKPINRFLKRDRLRHDVADVAWPILREELRAAELSLATVANHYRGHLNSCDLLGDEVPDIRAATLESVQRAWCAYNGSRPQQEGAWASLIQLFSVIFGVAEKAPDDTRREVRDIVIWLRTKVKIPAEAVNRDYLSESELDYLIFCCLLDIKAGIEFCEGDPDLLSKSTKQDHPNSAAAVINWTVALMTLLMAFTGLRPGSVTALRVNDWMDLNAKFSSIVWRHSKKLEENIVFTPVLLIRLLESYVRQTSRVREALGTKRIFLVGNNVGDWYACPSAAVLTRYLHAFAERHRLLRDGQLIALNSTMLRRTYATHQLYKGRSLWFIRAQLGHADIAQTKDYAQFDRYEHPAYVGAALDGYGRRVLDLWHRPVKLEALSYEERARVLASTGETSKDDIVGRGDLRGPTERHLQPCATCADLVTGGEFISAWEKELNQREERLRQLNSDPESADLLEAEGREFDQFMKNYELVKKDSEK